MEKTVNRQLTDAPLAHYSALYEKSDAREIAARTGTAYDEAAGRFSLTLMGERYYVNHPVFKTEPPLKNPYEEILILRYLLEGKAAPENGVTLAYSEMPWGSVYINQFKGRVLGRLARTFGRDASALGKAVEGKAGLRWERIGGADAAYRFAFFEDYLMSVLVWTGDDEFPASAQALFSENCRSAFTAEDMAVIGDIVIGRLR